MKPNHSQWTARCHHYQPIITQQHAHTCGCPPIPTQHSPSTILYPHALSHIPKLYLNSDFNSYLSGICSGWAETSQRPARSWWTVGRRWKIWRSCWVSSFTAGMRDKLWCFVHLCKNVTAMRVSKKSKKRKIGLAERWVLSTIANTWFQKHHFIKQDRFLHLNNSLILWMK